MTKARDIADGTSVDTQNFVTKANGAIEALDGSALTNLTPDNLDNTGTIPSQLLAGVGGGANTPSFLVYANSGTTVGHDSNAQIAFQDVQWDTHNAYDETTHFRFTCPAGQAGKYFFGASIELNITNATGSVRTMIWKNGVNAIRNNDGGNSYYHNVATYGVLDMAVGDYVEVRCYQNSGGVKTSQPNNADTYFFGYKLAE